MFMFACRQGLKVPVWPVARLKASLQTPLKQGSARDVQSRHTGGRGFQPLTAQAKTDPKLRLNNLSFGSVSGWETLQEAVKLRVTPNTKGLPG
jgi:hypothetical protein